MNRSSALKALVIAAVFSLGAWHSASADVAPGEVIDKTNWEKAEGLLPEPILNWVKKGDFSLDIGELSYNPVEFFPPAVLKTMETNVGRYDLNEEDIIIDVKTGKLPKFIEGIPFPKIARDDPKLAQKVTYNKNYSVYAQGNLRYPFQIVWLNRGGYERETECEYLQAPLDGYPLARETRNPDNIEKYLIIHVWKPFDIAGTAVMLWRYRGVPQDMFFGYLPAIRRVRRMSPANRSDSFIGSDGAVDDAMGYDGKIPAFEWKVVRQQEALLPFLSSNPERLVRNEMDEWVSVSGITALVYGYEKEGWQSVAWAPTNFVWVKRPGWVIRMTPKDPYYNYGVQDLWVDRETFWPNYKVINDRAGNYWKLYVISTGGAESADKKMRLMMLTSQQMIDDRRDHSSYVAGVSPKNIWAYFADMEIEDFSLAGFQKYCK